jgi:hypothetical protein
MDVQRNLLPRPILANSASATASDVTFWCSVKLAIRNSPFFTRQPRWNLDGGMRWQSERWFFQNHPEKQS